MKKVKIALWVLLLGFLGLIIYQNLDIFLKEQSLVLNLLVIDAYRADAVPNGLLFLAFFLIGLLMAYFSSLSERFRARKIIKALHARIDSHLQDIAMLKNEMESLKAGSASAEGDSAGGDEVEEQNP